MGRVLIHATSVLLKLDVREQDGKTAVAREADELGGKPKGLAMHIPARNFPSPVELYDMVNNPMQRPNDEAAKSWYRVPEAAFSGKQAS